MTPAITAAAQYVCVCTAVQNFLAASATGSGYDEEDRQGQTMIC